LSNSNIIDEDEIKKNVQSTVEFFIWKNKKRKPLVKTIIFRK
jgi:mRNA degradation ribonuclease J1/J2